MMASKAHDEWDTCIALMRRTVWTSILLLALAGCSAYDAALLTASETKAASGADGGNHTPRASQDAGTGPRGAAVDTPDGGSDAGLDAGRVDRSADAGSIDAASSDAGAGDACALRCAPANGIGSCATGSCAVSSCNSGFADCDGDPTNGCESNINPPELCACAVAAVDSDGDGVPDCTDACRFDPAHQAKPCGYGYTQSNLTSAPDWSSAPDVTLDCGVVALDTGATVAVDVCGTRVTPVAQTQSGGPDLWILPMQSLKLLAGSTLRLTGARPAVLAVENDATIDGSIDVSALGSTPGAGGSASCSNGTGKNGSNGSSMGNGGGGGGGGAFAAVGGGGGKGTTASFGSPPSGGSGGVVEGNATLVPLRGGCAGGRGGQGTNTNTGRDGGGGGGAIQISAGKLTLGSSAIIAASGGGGSRGGSKQDGGGGGGSGGAILLEAYVLTADPSAWISANGGSGASGSSQSTANGSPGTDGLATSTAQVAGGSGSSPGGDGGLGGAAAGAATSGGGGSCGGGFGCANAGAAGGGGGGGTGRLRINSRLHCTALANASPSASVVCP